MFHIRLHQCGLLESAICVTVSDAPGVALCTTHHPLPTRHKRRYLIEHEYAYDSPAT